MARVAEVKIDSTVLDPCCGTGGLLLAAAREAQRSSTIEGEPRSWKDTISVFKNQLFGFEKQELTTALAVVNMVRAHSRLEGGGVRVLTPAPDHPGRRQVRHPHSELL